ncbi:MAG: type 4 fimbrial biosis protein PilM, type pilus assembly protein PilM [Candidatus Parcubacteria bacterium]|jgi:type IV pilus assembly protein PilM
MSVLSRFLPPPTYITIPAVGVDISDTSLKYFAFKPSVREGAERELLQWGDIPIPSGVVDKGVVHDLEKLVLVLKEFKAKTGAEFVNVSLPEERAYVFETEVRRNTPLKEIRGLLEFKLEENVPIPSKDVLFDYEILENDEDDRTVRISVVAYAKETIQHYYDACIEAGLKPVSFEVESQAVARAVIPKDIKGTSMLVDFGKTRSGIGIVSNGILLYTSTIDIGGDSLSQALRKVVSADTSEAELTILKNTQGLIRGIDSSDAHNALITTVSVIKDALADRMQYWHLLNDNDIGRRIDSVILCGGSSNLKGLTAYLTESIGVPCVQGNVWENSFSLSNHVPPIDHNHSLGYATVIGLALKQST